MNMDLFFDHYFKFLRTKTETYKSDFSLINLDALEALKRQIPGILLEIWLNHIEIYVVWRTFELLLKIHSHISELEHFCRISVISELSFLVIGLKTKTWKSQKIFIFGSVKFKCMWICFSITISTFWAWKLKKNKNKKNKNRLKLTNLEGLESKVAELFWERCHLNNISRVLEITFSYFSILGFEFPWFPSFRFKV